MALNKSVLIAQLVDLFERELAALSQSARAAHEAATHEESQAEDKHDTRATEASYLAQGQAVRVAEVERLVLEFKGYLEQADRTFDRIYPGALIDLTSDGKSICSFYALSGGGTQIVHDTKTVVITTPKSPLGEALNGLAVGDLAEVETKAGIKEYSVLKIS
jgi:hypothetical protein